MERIVEPEAIIIRVDDDLSVRVSRNEVRFVNRRGTGITVSGDKLVALIAEIRAVGNVVGFTGNFGA